VIRSSLLVVALLAVGCKGKEPAKQAPVPEAKVQAGINATAFNVPAVDGTGPKLAIVGTAPTVQIDAAGSLHIGSIESNDGKPEARGSGQPLIVVTKSASAYEGKPPNTSLATLAKELGLPEIAKRRPSTFAAEGAAGSATGSDAPANPADVQFSQLGHPEPATSVPVQAPRVTNAFAIAHPYDVSAGVVVFADANAPATSLADVLGITGGFIAVKRGAELGALPFAFDRQEPPFAAPNRSWLEIRLGKPSILAMVPGKPMPSDMNNLAEVIKASGLKALDILVAADTKVSDLVASIEMARGAGVESIALGRVPAPNTPETMTREYTGPRLLAWDFFMQNQDKTDVTPFRTAFDAVLQPVHDCYTKELAKTKDAGGTAKLELLVETTGKVADLQATGVPKPLAACAGAAFEKAAFPPIATAVKITAQLAFVPR